MAVPPEAVKPTKPSHVNGCCSRVVDLHHVKWIAATSKNGGFGCIWTLVLHSYGIRFIQTNPALADLDDSIVVSLLCRLFVCEQLSQLSHKIVILAACLGSRAWALHCSCQFHEGSCAVCPAVTRHKY